MNQSWKQSILSGLAVIALTVAGVTVIVVSIQKARQRREIERLTALTTGLRKALAQYMMLPAPARETVGAAPGAKQEPFAALLAQCRDFVREARYDEAGALAARILELDPKNNEAKAIQLFAPDATPPWKLELETKLEDRVTFDFVETPFSDVIRFLQGITGANVIVDEKAIRDLGHPEVTLKVTDMKLGQALNWITAGKDLKYALLPEGIYIAAAKDFVGETTMYPYDVIHSGTGARFSCHLSSMPGPKGFRLHGTDGEGSLVKISGWGEAWRFDAPPGTEAALRGESMPAEPPAWLGDASTTLEERIAFDFGETPLRDVVAFIQQISGANIILDEKAFAEVANPEVTLKVVDMNLGQALHWIMKGAGLQYIISGEAIFITTNKRAAEVAQQSYCAINVTGEVRAPGGEPGTTFSGCLFYHLSTGGFFVLGKDADGHEIELKGTNTAPRPAAE